MKKRIIYVGTLVDLAMLKALKDGGAVKKLQAEVTELKALISEQKKEIREQKRVIKELNEELKN